jgi:hypothetical protein
MNTYRIAPSVPLFGEAKWVVVLEGENEGRGLSQKTYATRKEAEDAMAAMQQRDAESL